ncbi:UAA transporter family-domain-containing protein [Peziza echinospora]|nr:UAA transporter family-domain-containing protein [Peziza echinospora]
MAKKKSNKDRGGSGSGASATATGSSTTATGNSSNISKSASAIPSSTAEDQQQLPSSAERPVPPPTAVTTTSQINARPHLEAAVAANGMKRAFSISALAQTTIPMWVQTFVMISLIFGGCCSNVFALEAIVKEEPHSGHLITFAQFVVVAVEGFYYHFDRKSPTLLKPNQIPIFRWFGQIVLFFAVSVLNNYAFGFNISVPVHIILRSGGSMTTMLIGYLYGKRYSRVQVISVLVLSVGIVISAFGDAKAKSKTASSTSQFVAGLSIIFIAQVLSAFMGLYVEHTYAKYGSNWREGLFYTHAMALVLFIPFTRSIISQFNTLLHSAPLPIPLALPLTIHIPRQLFFLVLNSLTQYLCIRGVNVLGAVSSALTVTIVLNIRKLVSLMLSVWLFGNDLHVQVLVGAAVVFGGAFVYGLEGQRLSKERKAAAARETARKAVEAAREKEKEKEGGKGGAQSSAPAAAVGGKGGKKAQ